MQGALWCRCLEFARQQLHSALALLHEKAERQANEQLEHSEGSAKERDRVLLQLEADKAARVRRQQTLEAPRKLSEKGDAAMT